ncbi:MAG: hypothetical protein HKN18_14885 [Silicimonas sp.]|nr:hypothetical protein [Silicimonas sp.]
MTVRTAPVAPTGPSARHAFALARPMAIKAIFPYGTIVINGHLVSFLEEVALAAMGLAAALAGIVPAPNLTT